MCLHDSWICYITWVNYNYIFLEHLPSIYPQQKVQNIWKNAWLCHTYTLAFFQSHNCTELRTHTHTHTYAHANALWDKVISCLPPNNLNDWNKTRTSSLKPDTTVGCCCSRVEKKWPRRGGLAGSLNSSIWYIWFLLYLYLKHVHLVISLQHIYKIVVRENIKAVRGLCVTVISLFMSEQPT